MLGPHETRSHQVPGSTGTKSNCVGAAESVLGKGQNCLRSIDLYFKAELIALIELRAEFAAALIALTAELTAFAAELTAALMALTTELTIELTAFAAALIALTTELTAFIASSSTRSATTFTASSATSDLFKRPQTLLLTGVHVSDVSSTSPPLT